MDLELKMEQQRAKAQPARPAPVPQNVGNRDQNNGTAMLNSYSYAHGRGKTRAHDWEPNKEICVVGSMAFWAKKNWLEKKLFKAHLNKFKSDGKYQKKIFKDYCNVFVRFCDGNGLLQKDRMAEFASAKWGFGHNDPGFKAWMTNQYFNACNAYDSSYHGVTCQDFTECNFFFDDIAMSRL